MLNRTDNTDDYLRHNLMLVRTGRKSRAPGIRRCADCDEPYLDDHTGLIHCPTCRPQHRRQCRGCRALITNTTEGDRFCLSCQHQPSLFDTEGATG